MVIQKSGHLVHGRIRSFDLVSHSGNLILNTMKLFHLIDPCLRTNLESVHLAGQYLGLLIQVTHGVTGMAIIEIDVEPDIF